MNHSSMKRYRADLRSIKHFRGDLNAIMYDIATNGPVQSGMRIYEDFFQYSSGVYRHQWGSYAGGHAIKIIGWGVDSYSGLDYWIVANSWGTDWGMNGYYWIVKGRDECEIEACCLSGQPLY